MAKTLIMGATAHQDAMMDEVMGGFQIGAAAAASEGAKVFASGPATVPDNAPAEEHLMAEVLGSAYQGPAPDEAPQERPSISPTSRR